MRSCLLLNVKSMLLFYLYLQVCKRILLFRWSEVLWDNFENIVLFKNNFENANVNKNGNDKKFLLYHEFFASLPYLRKTVIMKQWVLHCVNLFCRLPLNYTYFPLTNDQSWLFTFHRQRLQPSPRTTWRHICKTQTEKKQDNVHSPTGTTLHWTPPLPA